MSNSKVTSIADLYQTSVMPSVDQNLVTLPGGKTINYPVLPVDPWALDKKEYVKKTDSAVTDPKKVGDIEALQRIIDSLYQYFAPDEIEYTPRSDEEIATSVSSWLRPGYEQAISDRKDITKSNNANLDADAIARGMGSSTYVTDVKSRQQNAESDDIGRLESDYGANFSKYMQENITADQDRLLEVEKINAQMRDSAYQRAYDAALALYNQYKKDPKKFNFNAIVSVAEQTYDNDLVTMDSKQRNEVFAASTPQGVQYRAELMAKVGTKGVDRLAGKYAI